MEISFSLILYLSKYADDQHFRNSVAGRLLWAMDLALDKNWGSKYS